MAKIKVILTKDFVLPGKKYKAGTEIEVTEERAKHWEQVGLIGGDKKSKRSKKEKASFENINVEKSINE